MYDTVSRMKTTIEIPDTLIREAKQVASDEGTTLKDLVEEGLRRLLSHRKEAVAFKLKKAAFKGKGLQAGIRGGSWGQIREILYEGRGG